MILTAASPNEIEAAFATVARQQIGALLVDSHALFNGQREQLAALAARDALPAIYHVRAVVEAGGLMSYGASPADAYRLAGVYAGRILKAAKALGLTFPLTLLGRADEVIE